MLCSSEIHGTMAQEDHLNGISIWDDRDFNDNKFEICNFRLIINNYIDNLFGGFQNMMHAMQDVTVGQISLIWEEKRLGS